MHARSRVHAFLLLSLIALLAPATAFAQGGISGTVTSSTTGLGVSGTVVFYDLIHDSDDDGPAATAPILPNGSYTVSLPAGTYAILTQNTQGFINKIWNNISCSAVCDVNSLTGVVVANTVVPDKNFVLIPGFKISGTVTNSTTLQPVVGATVFFTNSDAEVAFTVGVTGIDGKYTTEGGTAAGTVYAFTENNDGLLNEVYNNILCQDCNPANGTPIVVNADKTGIDFALAPGAQITGTVKDSNNNLLAGVNVLAFDSTGNNVVGDATTNASGVYLIVGLPTGSYFVATQNPQGLVDKLFNNINCPGGACSKVNNGVNVGTLVPVIAGNPAVVRDFTLTTGGKITGTVTKAADGTPISNHFVSIFTSTNGQSNFVGGAETSASGAFQIGLPAGTYFAAVLNQNALQNQLFDHLPCVNCQLNTGAPLVITGSNNTIGNVNFSLSPGGSITGRVTDSGTGLGITGNPPGFTTVQLLSSTGTTLGSAFPDNSGFYRFDGVGVGSYFVRTVGVGSPYVHKLFPNVICIGCNVTTTVGAQLVSVSQGNSTDNINFSLTQGGRISGLISNAQTAALLAGVSVQIFTSTGVSIGTYTSGNGTPNGGLLGMYQTSGMPAGNYFVKTSVNASTNLVDEVFNDKACVPCTVGIGTPVAVAGLATTPNINIGLAAGGSITGTVTSGGAPVSGMTIVVTDSTGNPVKTPATDASGNYTATGLPPGTYFMRTNPSAGTQNYLTQLYNGMPYLGAATTGTPVTLAAGATQSGVNFSLTTGGALSGVVTDAGTGGAIAGMQIIVYSADGKFVKSANTDAAGAYTITGVAPGTYYVSATSFFATSLYKDELYNDMPCLGCVSAGGAQLPVVKLPCSPGCDSGVATSTPVTITAGATRTGVDFALAGGAGVISGVVTGTGGLPLANVQVLVFNSAGTLVKSTLTATNSGTYSVRGLAPGDLYFARTIVSPYTPYYTDEAFNDMPCAPCAITSSTAITVTAGNTTTADFPLSPGGSISGRVTAAKTGAALAGIDVQLFTSTGALVKTTTTGSIGTFGIDGLPAGTYYAVALGANYDGEVYLKCSGACVPTSGTAIVVTTGATKTGVDFALTLTPNATSLNVTPSSLLFTASKAGATGALQFVTPAQTLLVSVAGLNPIWTASADQPWVQLTNGAGTGSGLMTVSIANPGNVLGGTTSATANVTITAAALTFKITVKLNVDLSTSTGVKALPFGNFDSPSNNATGLVGAIPVTGWALDDIGVAKVQLWRNCVEAIDRPAGACAASVPGGPANFVYIGDAAFLAGARNDVETQNPTLPQAYRGGWGYLMSTNALPHLLTGKGAGGQGSFTLYAYAVDVEGQFFQLGTKTISVDNDHAIVPFGSIDTPEQGGLMTTSVFASFGWAMTQQPKNIDVTSTASYKVYIDGVSLPLVPGVNWFPGLTRPDIAGAYPGLKNTDNALAAYYIDANALGLSNGLHTTGWDVIDDKGAIAGIGSRFFNVLIASSLTSSVAPDLKVGPTSGSGVSANDRPIALGPASNLTSLTPAPARVVRVQRGSDATPFTTASADTAGRYHVRFASGGRMALDLGGPVEAGYQVVGDELRALPAGSSLDAAGGTFAWMPPVPFLGPFELVFVSGTERVDVAATIADPTTTGSMAVHIDLPTPDTTVRGSFVVAGWALDPEAVTGTGIDTLHVWAYRRDGVAEPLFLGAAAVGGTRADVAAIYGEQFSAAGFTLTTAALPAGTYDVLVYPHRANGTFGDAETVRITVR